MEIGQCSQSTLLSGILSAGHSTRHSTLERVCPDLLFTTWSAVSKVGPHGTGHRGGKAVHIAASRKQTVGDKLGRTRHPPKSQPVWDIALSYSTSRTHVQDSVVLKLRLCAQQT